MAYRTVSTQAIMVVAGLLPAHLMARERQRKYRDGIPQEAAREKTFNKWQQEWDAADTGRWTKKLIKDVKIWSTRKNGMVDFHTTQMLTGHGCFGEYLYRFKRLADPKCVDCQYQRRCRACNFPLRQVMVAKKSTGGRYWSAVGTGDSSRCNDPEQGKLNAVKKFVDMILTTREEEERKRQQEEVLIIIA